MTNKEALVAAVLVDVPDNTLEKVLIDNGLIANTNYLITSAKIIDTLAIEVLKGILSVASMSEGGFSISYDIEGIKLRIRYLSEKHGIEYTVQPTITSPSLW